MAKFRQVQTSFWDDVKVSEEMSPEDKLFYLYILTNPSTKQIGIYKVTKKRMAFELGYSLESINSLLDRFIDHHKMIAYNEETRELAILNWGKYNLNRGGKPVEDLVTKELQEVEDTSLITKVNEHVPSDVSIKRVFNHYDPVITNGEPPNDTGNDSINDSSDEPKDDSSTTRGTTRGARTNKEELRTNKEEKESRDSSRKNRSKEYDPSSEYYQMAERLYKRILENNPEHKKPDLQKWADSFRKLVDLDGREKTKVIGMIDWVQAHDFWFANILSPDKLRKQWETLRMEVMRENKGGAKHGVNSKGHESADGQDKDYAAGRSHLLG